MTTTKEELLTEIESGVIGDALPTPFGAEEIDALVAAAKDDPGAPFETEVIARLNATKSADRANFVRVRGRLKKVGVNVGALDEALKDQAGNSEQVSDSSAVDQLIDIGESVTLFRETGDDDVSAAYALIQVDEHVEVRRINSNWFEKWLRKELYERYGKAASRDTMATAVATISAKALGAPKYEVFLRTARLADGIFIDMGDDCWRVVKVTAAGTTVIDNSQVYFRRPRKMLALPTPAKGATSIFCANT